MPNPLPQSWTLLRASTYQRMRWKNGAGWTSEIYRLDDPTASDGAPWLWRLSIAELERDGPFSVFPGIDRELVMLSGNGLNLCFDDGETHQLKPIERLSFAGERGAYGALIDGPSRDFNLMWQRAHIDATLTQHKLSANETLLVESDRSYVLHLISGWMRVPNSTEIMAPGDTALLHAHSAASYVLNGEAEILLIRIVKR